MPVNQIVDPLAEEGENADYGSVHIYCEYDSSQSGNLTNGMVVAIETVTAPPTTPFLIKKATTTPDFLMLGVVVNAPTGGYTPGSAVDVLIEGIAQVLFDANSTTAGHAGIQSSTTAGDLTDNATYTVGKTLATVLQTLTISSGSALVWCYVHKM